MRKATDMNFAPSGSPEYAISYDIISNYFFRPKIANYLKRFPPRVSG